jgi:predicted DNA-binding transcriptional regulator YafY
LHPLYGEGRGYPGYGREILKHGDAVTVIKPESLRELIKSEAQKMVKIYQGF